MDKKKKMTFLHLLMIVGFFSIPLQLCAKEDVSDVIFCDAKYGTDSQTGMDSITLCINVLDGDGNRLVDIEKLKEYLVIQEEGKEIMNADIRYSSGLKIPKDYTFSVLIDLCMSQEGKEMAYNAVKELVEAASDSCVYLSFFGEGVTSSEVIVRDNYTKFKEKFQYQNSDNEKYFYGSLYSKLIEFNSENADHEHLIKKKAEYQKNHEIAKRVENNMKKAFLFVFMEGDKKPTDKTDEKIQYNDIVTYCENARTIPKVFAFYYTTSVLNDKAFKNILYGITTANQSQKGDYYSCENIDSVLVRFENVVQDATYDYTFTYMATEGKEYHGSTKFTAYWGKNEKGKGAIYSIGTNENPWPKRKGNNTNMFLYFLIAIFIALLVIVFFFLIMKILIPFFKSKAFAVKYYKKYVPEQNVQRRICHYCKQDIQPGQIVVTKCKHIMHVHCWKQNGYRCAEYGQNCKTGIQEHVEWKELMTKSTWRDCYQMIAGVLAGFVSWILYDLFGNGAFQSLSNGIVNVFLSPTNHVENLVRACENKVSSFLLTGLLLGFFLSLVFRFNDEYRKKNWKIYLKIVGLSLLSGLIGLAAFALGSCILCGILSGIHTTYIPWYCSLPAYLLFSICTTLSLTIKSSIPVKSALLGGLISAIIGFLVLYFSKAISNNMLLDYIIYGGGLGASLVTVRMLAEKYFLVIQNGVKAGQKIPIHKWMNATGGGNKVSIGMTGECEIQMNWEKSNKVAKEHAQLFIDHAKMLPMIKPLATGVYYNTRAELPVGKPSVLSNGDTFKIGDTIFQYIETD